MHEFAKKIMEHVKANVESIGIEKFEGQKLDDLKDWTEIVKNIVKFDKDYKIVEAMKKSEENENVMEMLERYADYPERRYYDHYRYADGRFAPKGHGTYRRNYEEPPYYRMTPDMYREHEPRYYRDMDRSDGRMYYTETGDMNRSGNSESSYDRAKRMYTETKNTHRDNSTESKQAKMRELEQYTKELAEDVTQLLTDMTQEEKALLKSRMQVLMQKIQ